MAEIDPAVCHYVGMDTIAGIFSNDDGTFWGRCNCGTVYTTSAATTDDVLTALAAHRGPAINQEG